MGVINEDDMESKITKMIREVGLYTVIKFFGSYKDIVDRYGDLNLTREDKVNFIENAVEEVDGTLDRQGFHTMLFGASPIFYNEDDKEFQQIEYFNPGVVTVDVYGHGGNQSYLRSFMVKFSQLPEDVLNEVFEFILDVVEQQ
jgi:hypothetical protein